ncbi:hypothetical protein SGRI78S_03199 [Streptomyces griseus subsp. griseus]
MVRQPGQGGGADRAGEHQFVGVRECDLRAEQRMVRRLHPRRRDVPRPGGRGVDPVPLPLEGVRRQLHGARPVAGEGGPPVHPYAADVRLAEGGEEAVEAAFVAAEGAHRERVRAGLLGGVEEPGGEDRMGAHLGEGAVPPAEQVADGLVEPYGVAQVPVPVVGAQGGGVDRPAGHRREERHGGRPGRQAVKGGEQRCAQLLHVPRVRGVPDGDAPHADLLGGALLLHQLQPPDRTGHDDRPGSVDGGDLHFAAPSGQSLRHPGDGSGDRGHAPAVLETGQHPAAEGDDAGGVVQVQCSGHVRGGDLALAVADHDGRADAVRLPQFGERHHHREECGLHHVHPVQRRRTRAAPEHVGQRPVQMRRQGLGTRLDAVAEDPRGVEEAGGHAVPLGALAGEDEHRALPGVGPAPEHVRGLLPRGHRGQSREQFVGPGAADGRAVREGRARGGQRVADVHRVGAGCRAQPAPQPVRLLTQPRFGLGREQPRRYDGRLLVAGSRLGGVLASGGGGLLQDDVGVGAAHPERRDTGAAGAFGPLPGQRVGEEPQRAPGPVHVRGRFVGVQGAGQGLPVERHHHLDHARHSGGGLSVADVGLQRSEPQREAGGSVLPVGGLERLRLDRVAERGSGAVRLDGVDVRRFESGVAQGLAYDPLLRGAVRGGEAVARAVLVDRGAADHGEHPVPVAPGVGEPFEEQHADALGHAHAVGVGGERLAAPVGGEAALPGEGEQRAGGRHDRDAAGQRHRALALPQRLRTPVHRHQGGRAGGVDGDGRAFESERVGDSAGGDARRVAGAEVALQSVVAGHQQGRVVLSVGPDEDAGVAAAEVLREEARLFERLPGGFQEQPLLGVHGGRLTGADLEEPRVEPGHVVQESAASGVDGPGPIGVLVVEGGHVPAPVVGEGRDGVDAPGHHLPQVLGGGDAAGEPAAHPHDGDRLVLRRRARGRFGPRVVGFDEARCQLPAQQTGHRGRVGVVEDQRGGESHAGGRRQPVAQFDGGHGVHAELAEGLGLADGLRPGVAEHGCGGGPYLRQDDPVVLGRRGDGQGPRQLGGVRGVRVRGGLGLGLRVQHATCLREVADERPGPGGGEGGYEALPVHVGQDDGRLGQGQQAWQCGQGRAGVGGGHPLSAQQVGQFGFGLPGADGDGGDRAACRAFAFGQGVEVCAGGGERAVRPGAPDARDRGEQHEPGVRVVGAQHLGQCFGAGAALPHHASGVCGVALPDRGQLDGARGVHHGGQRHVCRGFPEEEAEGLGVGDVARHGDGRCTGFRQLGAQFRRRGTDEHQAVGAPGGCPAGHVAARPLGAAGDHHRPGRRPRRPGVARLVGHGQQPAAVGALGADGDLVLVAAACEAGGGPGHHVVGGDADGQVDEAAPAVRVLQCEAAAPAPQLGLRAVRDGVCVAHADRARGELPQTRLPGQGRHGPQEAHGGLPRQQGDHAGRVLVRRRGIAQQACQ